METLESKQTNSKDEEKGQVSTQAEPKDNKQSHYNETEKALAEKYKVEPKLCRLIADIVCEQTTGICNLIKLKQKFHEIEQQEQPETESDEAEDISDVIFEIDEILQGVRPSFCRSLLEALKQEKDSLKDESMSKADRHKMLLRLFSNRNAIDINEPTEDEEPSTGNPQLDELIEDVSYEAVALAHGCLELYAANQSLGEKIREKLDFSFQEALLARKKRDKSFDLECDLLPAIKWGNFLQGYMSGKGLTNICI